MVKYGGHYHLAQGRFRRILYRSMRAAADFGNRMLMYQAQTSLEVSVHHVSVIATAGDAIMLSFT